MTRSDRWNIRPATTKYWAFKDALLEAWGDREVPQQIGLVFYIPMPESWSVKKKDLMNGKPHQVKPDIDNLVKAFLDSLLEDDAAIWDVRATKYWGESGLIQISDLAVNEPILDTDP